MKDIRKRVEVIIYNPDLKKILVAIWKREDGKEFCCFPGGGIEEGESIKQAAVKECLEEVGIRIKEDQVNPIMIAPISPFDATKAPEQVHYAGDQTMIVRGVYACHDAGKHGCEGDAMPFTWEDPRVALGMLQNETKESPWRVEAVKMLMFNQMFTYPAK